MVAMKSVWMQQNANFSEERFINLYIELEFQVKANHGFSSLLRMEVGVYFWLMLLTATRQFLSWFYYFQKMEPTSISGLQFQFLSKVFICNPSMAQYSQTLIIYLKLEPRSIKDSKFGSFMQVGFPFSLYFFGFTLNNFFIPLSLTQCVISFSIKTMCVEFAYIWNIFVLFEQYFTFFL